MTPIEALKAVHEANEKGVAKLPSWLMAVVVEALREAPETKNYLYMSAYSNMEKGLSQDE